jgi:hypothetical protein
VLFYTIPTDTFFGSNGTIILPSTVQVQITGNGSVATVSVTAQITIKPGSTQPVSGVILVPDCLTLQNGQITVEISNASSLVDGAVVELIRIEKPECFVDGLDPTVVVKYPEDPTSECRRVTATKQRRNASLVVLFSITDECQKKSDNNNNTTGEGPPVAVIAGVSAAAAVILIAIGVAAILYHKRKRETIV